MPGETVALCQLDLPLVGFIQDGSALAIAPEATQSRAAIAQSAPNVNWTTGIPESAGASVK